MPHTHRAHPTREKSAFCGANWKDIGPARRDDVAPTCRVCRGDTKAPVSDHVALELGRVSWGGLKAPPVMVSPSAFWALVDRSGGPDACWPWTGRRDDDGYGRHKLYTASRIAWGLERGPIDSGRTLVCHTCDNPPCCNTSHMFLGDALANSLDAQSKGRVKSGVTCKRCGLRSVVPGRFRCQPCFDEAAGIRAARPRKDLRVVRREYAARWKAAGRCRRCSEARVNAEFCQAHTDARNARDRERRRASRDSGSLGSRDTPTPPET